MLDRNEKRDIVVNSHKLYKTMLRNRGLDNFRHYTRMKLTPITPEEISELNIIDHIYKTGDSLSKISFEYYGDTRYWWVLAAFNKKPIDNLIKMGDIIHVPLPLEDVMYLMTRNG